MTEETPKFDPVEVKKMLELFYMAGDVVELRMPQTRGARLAVILMTRKG
ncbi:MAG: hypothetical protein ACM3SR_18265 [Ignavibacteriales bacterium]